MIPLRTANSWRPRLGLWRDRWIAERNARREPVDLAMLEKVVVFIGYPRSGHSLIGSLLDAHSEVVLAHELDLFRYVEARFSREALTALLVDSSRRFTARGREWTGYSYAVPGSAQGSYETLRVLGDKMGGSTTLRLGAAPELLDRLRDTFEVPVKVLHIVRNPFDNIATLTRREQVGPTLDANLAHYRRLCEINADLSDRIPAEDHLELRHETLLKSPRETLRRLVEHIGRVADEDFLDRTTALVSPSPHRSRERIQWSAEARAAVEAMIEQFRFLRGYRFDD